jgi:hypothetical protein
MTIALAIVASGAGLPCSAPVVFAFVVVCCDDVFGGDVGVVPFVGVRCPGWGCGIGVSDAGRAIDGAALSEASAYPPGARAAE